MRKNQTLTVAFAITMLAGLITLGSDPAAAAASTPSAPVVFFAPGGDLADGQIILVGGVGFDPSSTLQFYECAFGDCQSLPFTASGDASGQFGRAVTVQRGLYMTFTPFDCAVVSCALAVSSSTSEPESSTNEMTASVALPFGPRPSVSMSPAAGLLDGQSVTVRGEHLVPGQTVHAWECQEAYQLCTRGLGESAVVDTGGRISLNVQLVRWIPDYMDGFGDVPMDCAVATCNLALTLSGSEYEDGYLPLALTRLNFAPRPAIAAGPARIVEGAVGARPVSVRFAISPAIDRPRLVRYRTLAWSAQSNDFEPAAGRVWIPAGTTSGSISVNVRGDVQAEGDEIFLVEIRSTRRHRGARAFGVVTIVDDD